MEYSIEERRFAESMRAHLYLVLKIVLEFTREFQMNLAFKLYMYVI